MIVVGAGIVGACVAYQLAHDGAAVTLLDRGPAPGAGVTGSSFAWIGDGIGGHWPGGAADLRPHILADYRRLAADVPAIPIRWCGSLSWPPASLPDERRDDRPDAPPNDRPDAPPNEQPDQRPNEQPDQRQDESDPGYHWVGAREIAALEPNLRDVPARAMHSPTDGTVDAAGMSAALVEAAERRGTRVHLETTATATTARTVTTDRGRLEADVVVLATGAALTEMSPAVLIRASAPPGLVRTIVSAPDFEVREGRPGELLFAAEAGQDPEAVVARFRAAWAGAEQVRVLSWAVGSRPMPPRGPIIGYAADGTYTAVMHSAVCLAPTAARLIAQELLTGNPAPELADCRHPHD
ncbi:D-amino-acid oxidase [Actinoplanes sp. NBRC 103695]|nr:D-amino-acid oxidase [Actinoplanes sp. NBRC 103695]